MGLVKVTNQSLRACAKPLVWIFGVGIAMLRFRTSAR